MYPVKVIHVITRLDHGGSAQNTLLTALGHHRVRFTPMVIAGEAGTWDAQGGGAATRDSVERLRAANIPCRILSSLTRPVHPAKDLAALSTLIAVFRREHPAIVHTHTSKAGVLGRLAAWLTRVPTTIHTPHGHVFYGHFGRVSSQAFCAVERVLARRTTWLIALTDAERAEHLERGVGVAERFAVIPSGIEVRRFHRMAGVTGRRPEGFDPAPDSFVIGSVGWLTPVKGHQVLIEALARLQPTYPQLRLILVGTGPLRESLAGLSARRGLAEAVRFLGERTDVAECLAGMDLFVLPSLNEGMGRALVEAMAAGRPVIASAVGGVPAIVDHGRTGLLVPPGNVEALAGAIADLIEHPVKAKALADAAAKSIEPRFDALAMVRAVEAVYAQAMAVYDR